MLRGWDKTSRLSSPGALTPITPRRGEPWDKASHGPLTNKCGNLTVGQPICKQVDWFMNGLPFQKPAGLIIY